MIFSGGCEPSSRAEPEAVMRRAGSCFFFFLFFFSFSPLIDPSLFHRVTSFACPPLGVLQPDFEEVCPPSSQPTPAPALPPSLCRKTLHLFIYLPFTRVSGVTSAQAATPPPLASRMTVLSRLPWNLFWWGSLCVSWPRDPSGALMHISLSAHPQPASEGGGVWRERGGSVWGQRVSAGVCERIPKRQVVCCFVGTLYV